MCSRSLLWLNMRRREFITILGGAATTWPLAAHAQPAGKLPTIGYLGSSTPSAEAPHQCAPAKIARTWLDRRPQLRGRISLGGGTNRTFRRDRSRGCPTQGRHHCHTGSAVPALKQATSVIPIVFAVEADPVGRGLIASLARPGGNITGLSNQQPDIAGKRVELLREVVPSLRRLAVLANVDFPNAMLEKTEIQTAAGNLGLEITSPEIRKAEDIVPAFEAIKGRSDALYVVGDLLVVTNRIRINILAVGARLPTIYGSREYVDAGGLMSYGANFPDLSDALPTTSTKFCAEQSRPTCRSSNRPV